LQTLKKCSNVELRAPYRNRTMVTPPVTSKRMPGTGPYTQPCEQ